MRFEMHPEYIHNRIVLGSTHEEAGQAVLELFIELEEHLSDYVIQFSDPDMKENTASYSYDFQAALDTADRIGMNKSDLFSIIEDLAVENGLDWDSLGDKILESVEAQRAMYEENKSIEHQLQVNVQTAVTRAVSRKLAMINGGRWPKVNLVLELAATLNVEPDDIKPLIENALTALGVEYTVQ